MLLKRRQQFICLRKFSRYSQVPANICRVFNFILDDLVIRNHFTSAFSSCHFHFLSTALRSSIASTHNILLSKTLYLHFMKNSMKFHSGRKFSLFQRRRLAEWKLSCATACTETSALLGGVHGYAMHIHTAHIHSQSASAKVK